MERENNKKTPPENIKKRTTDAQRSLVELRDTVTIRTQIQAEITQSIRKSIKDEGFKGEEIHVLPDFKDKTAIYIQTSHAQLQIDLHYDETREDEDSLRKDTKNQPEISLTWKVDGELYSIDWYDDLEDVSRIAGELLKQIERKKNPEAFWYKEIQFWILSDNTIIVAWKRENGDIKRLNFFDFIDDEGDRVMLYGYIAHSFWKPLDPKVFEELENKDGNKKEGDWWSTPKDTDWKNSV